jgi:hypothetical protein
MSVSSSTRDSRAADLALATYENVRDRLHCPGSHNIRPYDIPAGMKNLGVSMIFSSFLSTGPWIGKTSAPKVMSLDVLFRIGAG